MRVFATNNARDSRKLMRATELHAGLIVILPRVTPATQRELFQRALVETSKLPDVVNKAVEIESDQVRVYELPNRSTRICTQLYAARMVGRR